MTPFMTTIAMKFEIVCSYSPDQIFYYTMTLEQWKNGSQVQCNDAS